MDVNLDWREKAELVEYSEGWRRDLLLRMNTQPYLLFPVLFKYKFILFFDVEKHLHGFTSRQGAHSGKNTATDKSLPPFS